MVPCEITRIDEKGVSYKTPLADSGVIANDKIKAVVLTLDGRGPVELTKEKRDRLLTLPRMYKDNPPTHLIRSCDGDYLRGRVIEMDDHKLVVELRTKPRELPRDRISRIIWLHPDELEGAAAAKKKTNTGPRPLVQAVHDNGTRLTFHPTQFKDSILSGVSDALGPCRIALESVDQLLIGNTIDEAVTKTAYQQWRLRNAQEPKFVTADANAPAAAPMAWIPPSSANRARFRAGFVERRAFSLVRSSRKNGRARLLRHLVRALSANDSARRPAPSRFSR